MLFCWICLVCYSGNSIQSEAEWLISVGSAGPYSCLPTYEDAQENSGPPVICVLCHLRPHRSSHLHSKTSDFMMLFFLQCFWMCLPFLKYNEYEKYFEIYKSDVWMNHRTALCFWNIFMDIYVMFPWLLFEYSITSGYGILICLLCSCAVRLPLCVRVCVCVSGNVFKEKMLY